MIGTAKPSSGSWPESFELAREDGVGGPLALLQFLWRQHVALKQFNRTGDGGKELR